MKKLDLYILKAFAGPFVLTFFITLFILLMQFLWKYIDDLVGKGLEWYTVAELLFYASANMVPLALPLAVLLAALMTFGNLGERFELAALKSAGISMFRFMRAAMIAGLIISFGALLFSNYALPKASLKFWTKLIDITHKKPALNIKVNEFYNDIDQFSLLINEKDDDNLHVGDITIYDNTENKKHASVLIAEDGLMYTDDRTNSLVLKLYDGKQYQEMQQTGKRGQPQQHLRLYFDEWERAIDLSGFAMSKTSEDMYKNHYRMLNMRQLRMAADSIVIATHKRMSSLDPAIQPYFFFKRDSLFSYELTGDTVLAKDFVSSLNKQAAAGAMKRALVSARNISSFSRQIKDHTKYSEQRISDHYVEYHRKLILAIACLVFLFVGAPLGAIIRKGGFGMPVVTSVLIFIVFYVLYISGEKLVDQGVWRPFFGMWFPIFILFPFSLVLTWKAKNDSAIVDGGAYRDVYLWIERRLGRILKKPSTANQNTGNTE